MHYQSIGGVKNLKKWLSRPVAGLVKHKIKEKMHANLQICVLVWGNVTFESTLPPCILADIQEVINGLGMCTSIQSTITAIDTMIKAFDHDILEKKKELEAYETTVQASHKLFSQEPSMFFSDIVPMTNPM